MTQKKIGVLYDYIKSLNISDYDELRESDIIQDSETQYEFKGIEGKEIWGVFTEQEAIDQVFEPYSMQWDPEELIDTMLDMAYEYGYETENFDEDAFVDAAREELVKSWSENKDEGVEFGFAPIYFDDPAIVDFVDGYYVVFEDVI